MSDEHQQRPSSVLYLVYAAIVAAVVAAFNSSLWYWLVTDELYSSGRRSAYLIASIERHALLILAGLVVVILALKVFRLPAWFPAAVAVFMLIGAAPFRLAFLIDVESYWPSTILILALASLWEFARLLRSGQSPFLPGEPQELLNVGIGVLVFVMSVALVNDVFADFEPAPDAIPAVRLALYCLMPAVVGFVACYALQCTRFAVRGLWTVIAALGLSSAVLSMVPEFRWEPHSFWWRAWMAEVLGAVVLAVLAAVGERLGARTGAPASNNGIEQNARS